MDSTTSASSLNLRALFLAFRRWRTPAIAVFAAAVVLGGVIFVATPPKYESRASFIFFDYQDYAVAWLQSPRARDVAAEQLLNSSEGFDEIRDKSQVALRLKTIVQISSYRHQVDIVSRAKSPESAQRAAAAYVVTLESFRPILENVTISEAFNEYYKEQFDERSAEQARRDAEFFASTKPYWLQVETPGIHPEPVSPNLLALMILAGALGLASAAGIVIAGELLRRQRGNL